MEAPKEYYQRIKKARETYKNGDLLQAIRLFEDATSEIADEDDMLDLGILYLENNEIDKSQMIINDVINTFPKHSRGYYCMGYVLEEISAYEKALVYYEKAYKLEKNNFKYAFALGKMYDEIGKKHEAKKCYKIAISLKEDDFYSNLNLGSLYEKEGKLKLALEYSKRAYEIDPEKAIVNYNLGVVYSRLSKYDLALEHYLNEIKLQDCYTFAYYNLGLLYKDVYKDYEKAKYYYLKGLYFAKEDVSLWYNLGCLYALLNDYENAYQCLLMVCLKRNDSLSWIESDSELMEFRKTKLYEKLRNGVE